MVFDFRNITLTTTDNSINHSEMINVFRTTHGNNNNSVIVWINVHSYTLSINLTFIYLVVFGE